MVLQTGLSGPPNFCPVRVRKNPADFRRSKPNEIGDISHRPSKRRPGSVGAARTVSAHVGADFGVMKAPLPPCPMRLVLATAQRKSINV